MDRMKTAGKRAALLPTTREEMRKRGWNELDVILVAGDAYVDHPSYGAAVIGRVLEADGFTVGIIAQPDWRSTSDFLRLGRPRLFFGITAGNVDSLVANYTASKKRRSSDDYSPGGKAARRPDRAVIVYANRVREAFGRVPIVAGGIEASLRRLAHYDWWDDAVRRSILLDSRADLLVYGMGETQVLEIARRLQAGEPPHLLDGIRGTAVVRGGGTFPPEGVILPSYEEVKDDPGKFNAAFRAIYSHQDPFRGKPLIQPHGDQVVVQFPPALPLSPKELDRVHELPYARRGHPGYDGEGGVKGLVTVRFSLISHRGCCGECSFCSLYFHQGRIVQSRSPESILREARKIASMPDFKGTITDIGGPTANLYFSSCARWAREEKCENRKCLVPRRCENLKLGYRESLDLYRRVRELPGVKHVFIGSGFRYDLLTGEDASSYLRELCAHYISGQMKVAPEHSEDNVLRLMNKTPFREYENFVRNFEAINAGRKQRVYLVNYFMSSHPGETLRDALNQALCLARRRMRPEQVQDFIPLPMTLAGCMYHAGGHPLTGEKVYVAKTPRERKMRRALLQPWLPAHRRPLERALKELGAPHLLHRLQGRGRRSVPSDRSME